MMTQQKSGKETWKTKKATLFWYIPSVFNGFKTVYYI